MTRAVDAPGRAGAAEHASDAALLRALDGETDAAERVWLDAHLAECAPCRARDAALRADVALVRSGFAGDVAAHAPPFTWGDVVQRARAAGAGVAAPSPAARPRGAGRRPNPGWRAGWGAGWRIAAGLLVAVGAAAAAPRALRWVRGAGGGAAAERPLRPPPATSPAAEPRAGAPTADVAFPLRGDTLHVVFDAPQRAGALDLVAGPAADDEGRGDAVRVEVRGGGAAARLLVLPDGVRVRNRPEDAAAYRVVVPGHARAVRVVAGARVLAAVDRARLGAAPLRIPLSP